MERLTPGITEEDLKALEHRDILIASIQDLDWWGKKEDRFSTRDDCELAIQNGNLVQIEVPNRYFTCPSDIRNDKGLQLLRPSANKLLFTICRDVNSLTGYADCGIKLAITSLYRPDNLQRDIANSDEWYRAAKVGTSAHAAGAAFDISIRSHYATDRSSGKLMAVNTWNPESARYYQPIIFECLADVISSYAEKGACNLIIENVVEGNEYWPTCLHTCVSPNYL